MYTKLNEGFTLIEIAMSLAVIGLLLHATVDKLPSIMHYNKMSKTSNIIEDIRESIYGYVLINKSLPCADVNDDGIGDKNVLGKCYQAGTLPWANLGIGRYDAWGKPFNYVMDKNYNMSGNKVYLTAKYEIKKTHDEVVTTEQLTFPAIVWSNGAMNNNSKDELENRNNDDVFVSNNYVSNHFDDIVVGISKYTLIHRLLRARELPNNEL